MAGLLSSILEIATIVFAVTSMMSVGFAYTFKQLIAPLRSPRSVLIALFANLVAVPLLALVVVRVLNLAAPLAIGLLLVATATGAPFVIRLTHIARGDVRLAAGLLVLLLAVSMVYMPIIVPLIAPEATVSPVAIAMPLLLTMLLPLGVGLLVDWWNEGLADRLQPLMTRLSSVSLGVLVLATFWLHLPAIGRVFGTGAIFGALIVVAGAFAIGYMLPGPDLRQRKVLGLGTAQRGVAAAMVVATQAFDDPTIAVMVMVTMVVSMALLFPLAWAMGRGASRRAALRVLFLGTRQKEPWV
jgi:BASS family bile acid:Na+ symporter